MSIAEAPQNNKNRRSSAVTSDSVRLTPAEKKVLKQIARGISSQKVADNLIVSKRTVDFHLYNIYSKLHVKNRVQAIQACARLGLIQLESITD